MGMAVAFLEVCWDVLPSDQIDQIIACRCNNLWYPCFARICHTVRPRCYARAKNLVTNFLWGKVHYGCKLSLRCERFERPPAHSSGVKHGHFEPAFFQFWLECHH